MVTVSVEQWFAFAQFAKDELRCRFFSFLTAVDWKDPGLEVVVKIDNVDDNLSLMMKTRLGPGISLCPSLTPLYREALAERGLVLLNWGHGGWVHIFSAQPIRNIPDLQKAKLFTAAGDDGMVQWYKQNGFQPVPLELTDVLMGLNTGLIDAYPSPPYGALVFQWYRQTSHMLDVPLSPVFGATVMTERAWNRIDEADRDALLEAAAEMQAFLFEEVPRQDQEAVAEMEKRGLTVSSVSEAEVGILRAGVDTLTATWRGDRVPADIYDAALAARSAFRAN